MRAAGLRSANTAGPALLPGAHPAHRARLHPGERGHRGHGLPHPRRALLRSSPAGVRLRGAARRHRTARLGRLNFCPTHPHCRHERRRPRLEARARCRGHRLADASTSRAPRPTCSRPPCSPSSTSTLATFERERPARAGADLGQEERLHRRRRHQGIHRHPRRRPPAYTLIRRGQQVFDRLEALPCPTRRGHPRLCPRRRPGARARLPLPRRRRRRAALAGPAGGAARAFIRASAARCARCA